MSHHSSPVPCILPSNQAAPASSRVIPTIISNLLNPSIMLKVTSTIAQVVAPITAVIVNLIYIVDEQGNLYSAKLSQFAEVSKDAKLLSQLTALKHNPTNVYGSGIARRSDEARRPLYLLTKGKFFKQEMIATPVKTTKTNAAGKQIKVVQTGPRTIYVAAEAGDTRPYSLNPEQFEALSKDLAGLKYLPKLKHLPTCVEISLTRGLISTDENRPMYRIVKGKLALHFATEQAEQAASKAVAKVAETTKEKAPSKKEMKAKSEAAKAAKESTPVVDQVIAETTEA